MSTLGNLPTVSETIEIPPSGAWFGTVHLNSSTLPAIGPTVLTIGDLVLAGAVVRTDFQDHPRGGGLVVATVRGGAGWRLPVTRAGAYASEGGIRLSTVLADIAGQAGESYIPPADVDVGQAYAWQAHSQAAPVHCGSVLDDLVTRGFLPTWRVEPFTGKTRFDGWPALGAADGRGRILNRDLAQGRRSVGLDVSVAAFLPGATLEGVTIDRTIIRETAGKIEVEVYGSGEAPTARQSIRRVLVGLFPWLPGLVAVAGQKGKGLAIRSASGLLHLAGGPEDPAVVRKLVDKGTAGTVGVPAGSPGPVLQFTNGDGDTLALTFAIVGGAITITAVPPEPKLNLVVRMLEGSKWVTCK